MADTATELTEIQKPPEEPQTEKGKHGSPIKRLARLIHPPRTAYDPDRRKFLKLGGGALVAGFVGGLGAPHIPEILKAISSFEKANDKSVEIRLAKYGLEDFSGYYTATTDLFNTYGVTPNFWDKDPYSILTDVLAEKIDQTEIEMLRDHWGELSDEAVELARRKANYVVEVSGIHTPEITDSEQQIRDAWEKLAKLLPAHVLMAPETLFIGNETTYGGFYEELPQYDSSGNSVSSKIALPSIDRYGLEEFYRVAFHELGHSEVTWAEGKPYIKSRELFAGFRETEIVEAKKILDSYFSMGWDQARSFAFDDMGLSFGSYLPGNDSTSLPNLQDTEKLEKTYFAKYGLQSIPSDTSPDFQSPMFRYNRLVHTIGQHTLEIQKKLKETNGDTSSLNQQEQTFVKDSGGELTQHLQAAFDGVYHFLRSVAPAKDPWGALIGYHHPPQDQNNIATKSIEAVQLARMKAFSTLGDSELTSFLRSSQALRNHLGLDTPPIPLDGHSGIPRPTPSPTI